MDANAEIAQVRRHNTSLRQKVYELNKWKRKLEAVGVTQQCYLRRLQERIEFVNSELISVHKNQILFQVISVYHISLNNFWKQHLNMRTDAET